MHKTRLIFLSTLVFVSVASGNWMLHTYRDRSLMEAIDRADAPAVRQLLNAGANPNTKGWPSPKTGLSALYDRMNHPGYYHERNALMLAAATNNPAVLRLLLSKGANISAVAEGSTALSWAARCGQMENVRVLLDAGAARKGPLCAEALSSAVSIERTDIVELLLSRGVDVNEADAYGNTALSSALTYGAGMPVIKQLIDHGARLDFKTGEGLTALMCGVTGGNTEVVQFLLQQHPDLKAQDRNGWTPLMHCVRTHNPSIVKALLASGADVNARTKDGGTALMVAAENDEEEFAKILLENKAKTDLRDGAGETALSIAVRNNSTLSKLLDQNGSRK